MPLVSLEWERKTGRNERSPMECRDSVGLYPSQSWFPRPIMSGKQLEGILGASLESAHGAQASDVQVAKLTPSAPV
jgi:hypothetical protein